MAETAYADASLIRDVDDIFKNIDGTPNQDDFPDADLERVCLRWANPELDSMLAVAGITVPLTDPPQWAKNQAARLTAAFILSGRIAGFTATKPEKATALEEQVSKAVNDLVEGKRVVTGLSPSSSAGPVVVDSDPETRHYHSIFTGDETQWKLPTECRETTDGSGVCTDGDEE